MWTSHCNCSHCFTFREGCTHARVTAEFWGPGTSDQPALKIRFVRMHLSFICNQVLETINLGVLFYGRDIFFYLNWCAGKSWLIFFEEFQDLLTWGPIPYWRSLVFLSSSNGPLTKGMLLNIWFWAWVQLFLTLCILGSHFSKTHSPHLVDGEVNRVGEDDNDHQRC